MTTDVKIFIKYIIQFFVVHILSNTNNKINKTLFSQHSVLKQNVSLSDFVS